MLLRLENVNLTHLVLASGKLALQKRSWVWFMPLWWKILTFFPFFSTWQIMFGRLLTMSCKGRRDFFVVSRKTRKRGRKRERRKRRKRERGKTIERERRLLKKKGREKDNQHERINWIRKSNANSLIQKCKERKKRKQGKKLQK